MTSRIIANISNATASKEKNALKIKLRTDHKTPRRIATITIAARIKRNFFIYNTPQISTRFVLI